MEYDLTRLGAGQFARLSQQLIESALGFRVPNDSVSGNLVSVLSGRIAFPAGPSQQVWDGPAHATSIFFASPSREAEDNWPAMKTWIESQLNDWERSPGSLKWRGGRIEYLFYICNAELGLSFDSDIGLRINNLVRSRRALHIKECMVWDYGRICRLLDGADALRREFSGLIAPDGVLAELASFVGSAKDDLGDIIARQLSMDLIADQWVRLGQAAAPNRQKIALSSVAIDLPIPRKKGQEFAAQHILSVGNGVLRSSGNAKDSPHLVLIGGPGQGKTTIGQLVCQVYRTFLLAGSSHLSDDVSELAASVRRALARVDLPSPANRRWPIRIELAAYADESAKNDSSLLKYIANRVSLRSSDNVTPAIMREWLKCWPWLVVLDGLDEVPSQGARDSLVHRISEFFIEAAQANSDLLVIATTRPQGYMGEFTPDRYNHISMSPLEPNMAASYAARLAEVQHASDPDLLRKLVERTSAASQEESTARLMRTPLQVTIMSLLLENRERAPSARYQLFEAYYQAIYSRESTKPGALGAMLESLRSHIYALHDRVGLLLQAKAEGAGESDTALPQEELRSLAWTRLVAEGYGNKEADRLTDQVIQAVTQRLVLIVPKGIDEVGFEVRSIQEFMAARALASGRDAAILSRLKATVSSSYWRNTWLFAAGRIFTEREHSRRDLIAVVEDIDSHDVVNVVVSSGAELALDMIDDDLTIGAPGLQRVLALHALTLLHYPSDDELKRRAGILYRCGSDSVVRAAIDHELEACLAQKHAERLGAYGLLGVWQEETGSLAARSRQLITRRRLATVPDPSRRPWERQRQNESVPTVEDVVETELENAEFATKRRSLLKSGISDALSSRPSKDSNDKIIEMLQDRITADVLGQVTLSLIAEHPGEAATLRTIMRSWLSRLPAAYNVLQLTPYSGENDI